MIPSERDNSNFESVKRNKKNETPNNTTDKSCFLGFLECERCTRALRVFEVQFSRMPM